MKERGRRRWIARSVIGIVGVVCGACGGCASSGSRSAASRDAVRMTGDGLTVEYRADIDRFTAIGPEGGPNLVFTQLLDQRPAKDEAYTFYGGCYTWIAPQNGALGWRDGAGKERAWPPDPAMDTGSGLVEQVGERGVRIESPIGRTGLREVKSFQITGPRAGSLVFALENTTNTMVTAGPWVNTAVAPGSVIAVRTDHPPTDVWGWGDQFKERFLSITRPAGGGWCIVEPDTATWEGGIKVYLDAPSGGGEIAIWRDGWWLHRKQLVADEGRLRAAGEGPVAIYIQPVVKNGDVAIVEAELYGRLADIAPWGRNAGEERWTVIQSATPDVSVLPKR